MEPFLSKDPEKTKERILSFLLVFLILLVPISILTSNSVPEVQITGLTSEEVNQTAQRVSIDLKSNAKEELYCVLNVDLYRDEVLVDRFLKEFGNLPPGLIKTSSIILNTPSGHNEFGIKPECFPK